MKTIHAVAILSSLAWVLFVLTAHVLPRVFA